MTEDKISIIVPVYNLENYIRRCVGSILAQTHRNLEIIAVDDGSRDGSLEVLRELAREDDRVKVVHQENGGVTAARLRGLREATGQWIGFADADDATEPWMYKRLLKNARDYDADISHCGYVREKADGTLEYHHNTGVLRKQDREQALAELIEERQVEPGLWNKLYKKELFEGLSSWMDPSVRINEDMLMNFYLFSAARQAVYEDVCPYRCCWRAGSASRARLNSRLIHDPIRVRRQILEQCPENLKQTALDAYLRVCLYCYARMSVEKGDFSADKEAVRAALREKRKDLGILSKRNQVLAYFVCYVPGLFGLVFRNYVRFFLGGVYE